MEKTRKEGLEKNMERQERDKGWEERRIEQQVEEEEQKGVDEGEEKKGCK
jgi:hypothetical protein